MQTPLEKEIAEVMVVALNWHDVKPDSIHPESDLMKGELAMDSIDLLELSLALSKKYSVDIESEENNWYEAFATLKGIANLVERLRVG